MVSVTVKGYFKVGNTYRYCWLAMCSVQARLKSASAVHDTQRNALHAWLLQAMAFLAGANSIFSGDKLLTTPNPAEDTDTQLFKVLGLKGRPAFLPYAAGEDTSKHGNAASL